MRPAWKTRQGVFVGGNHEWPRTDTNAATGWSAEKFQTTDYFEKEQRVKPVHHVALTTAVTALRRLPPFLQDTSLIYNFSR
jgi:hypothetical protein